MYLVKETSYNKKEDMFDYQESDVSHLVAHLKSLAEIRCLYYLNSKVITMKNNSSIIINCDSSRLVIFNHHLSNTSIRKGKHLIFQTYPKSIYYRLTSLSIEQAYFYAKKLV